MSTRDILPDEAITWLPVQPDRRPFLCPVCAGRGWVDGGFYGGYTQSTNARTTQACRGCGGSGIIFG